MHVLIIASWYPSEISKVSGIFIKHQVDALAKQTGYQVGVLSPVQTKTGFDQKFKQYSEPAHVLTQAPVNNKFPFLPGSTGYFWVKKGYEMYLEYVEKTGVPDVIHAHSSLYAGALALKINKAFSVPYVLTEHSSYVTRKNLLPWKIPRVKKIFNAAQYNFAVSSFVKNEIVKNYQLSPEKWGVIPNMVSNHFFVEQNLQPDDQTFVFTNIGALIDVKAQDLLLKAFAACSKQVTKKIKLRIVGSGEKQGMLHDLSRSLGVENIVEWIEHVEPEKLPGIISESHVVISSSSTETFGLTLAESLAVGRPVISTDSGGPRDIITDKVGVIVKNGDYESLAQAMEAMIKSYSDYSSSSIKAYAKQRFHEQVIVSMLQVFYAQANN